MLGWIYPMMYYGYRQSKNYQIINPSIFTGRITAVDTYVGGSLTTGVQAVDTYLPGVKETVSP